MFLIFSLFPSNIFSRGREVLRLLSEVASGLYWLMDLAGPVYGPVMSSSLTTLVPHQTTDLPQLNNTLHSAYYPCGTTHKPDLRASLSVVYGLSHYFYFSLNKSWVDRGILGSREMSPSLPPPHQQSSAQGPEEGALPPSKVLPRCISDAPSLDKTGSSLELD